MIIVWCPLQSPPSWLPCWSRRPWRSFPRSESPKGEPQTTPMWFMWKHGSVHFSLVEGARSCATSSVSHAVGGDRGSCRATRYLELRGRVELGLDPELALEREVASEYSVAVTWTTNRGPTGQSSRRRSASIASPANWATGSSASEKCAGLWRSLPREPRRTAATKLSATPPFLRERDSRHIRGLVTTGRSASSRT